jgi:hypothetical protein
VDDPKLWALLIPLLAVAGTWGVLKYQSASHETRVKTVEDETQGLKIEVAVLKSRMEDHGSRMDTFTEALAAMEDRIIARITQLFDALSQRTR